MNSPRTRKNSLFAILFTLFLSAQISACGSEGNHSAEQEVPTSNNEVDTVISENNPNEINQPAVIGGVDVGSVTEDTVVSSSNTLITTGQLNIADNNIGEDVFVSEIKNTDYGTFIISLSGFWGYQVNNDLAAIQNLTNGQTLTESIDVNSIDGTTHTITITINGLNEPGTPAIITGVDSGSVTEDMTVSSNNTLVTAGQLNISDSDIGEDAFFNLSKITDFGSFMINASGFWAYEADNNLAIIQNLTSDQTLTESVNVNSIDGTPHTITITINGLDEPNTPAVITGVDTGSVTEDYDPDNDGLLETSGKLDIFDTDSGESVFKTAGIAGNYGNLFINTSGNWVYSAASNLNVIQNLGNGDSLVDAIVVSSADNTTHTIYITINGVDETSASYDITLSWSAPTAREGNTALALSEIAGYKIYYGTTSGQYGSSVTINNNQTTSYVFEGFAAGTYYFVMTTVDTDGLESQQSGELQKTN